MRHIDVTRKRKTRWPWVLGALVLLAAAWGVTILLAPPPEPGPTRVGATAADTLPPASVPAPPDAVFSTRARRSVTDLAPLGEEHAGETVRAEGQVVATGDNAFWMVAGSQILRVESRRMPRKGDSLSVEGTLRPSSDQLTQRIAQEVVSRHPNASEWKVVNAVKLVVSSEPPPDSTTRGGGGG